MDIGTITRRYAVALYKYACTHQQEKRAYDETLALCRSYMQYPALHRTIANPVLSKEKKEEVLCLAAGGDVSHEFRQFIRLVIRHKREMFLLIICIGYLIIYRQEKKLLHLHITTAVPVDKGIERQIVDKFERLTHETVDVETVVEPQIIGGCIIRWDTYRWDASVAARLRQIKKELTEQG